MSTTKPAQAPGYHTTPSAALPAASAQGVRGVTWVLACKQLLLRLARTLKKGAKFDEAKSGP